MRTAKKKPLTRQRKRLSGARKYGTTVYLLYRHLMWLQAKMRVTGKSMTTIILELIEKEMPHIEEDETI